MYYKDSRKVKFIVYGLNQITVRIGAYSSIVNVKNNIATFKIPALKPGTYAIEATGKSLYAKTGLVVKHVLSLAKVKVKHSARKLTLTATLKTGKTPLKYKQVVFRFNGIKYTKKTNSKGIAKLTVKSGPLKKLKTGSRITYKASYGKDSVKRTVKVLK